MAGERETGLLASSEPLDDCSVLGPLVETLLLRGGRSLPGSSTTYYPLQEVCKFLPPSESKVLKYIYIFYYSYSVADPEKWFLFLQAQHDILYQLS